MKRTIAGAALALMMLACRAQPAPSEPVEGGRPRLDLLTSLPLVFGESFSLESAKHPLMERLERDFDVRLIDGPEKLPPGGLLLAAQPQALTAERLVALDAWVRKGGRLVLLADPRLVWESGRPLGDKGRPPYAYPDTGLLRHWGLRLSVGDDGPAVRELGGEKILTGSPGVLEAEPGGACKVSADALVARCSLGRGEAVVVADADFVQAGVPGGVDGPTSENHDALAAELKALGRN